MEATPFFVGETVESIILLFLLGKDGGVDKISKSSLQKDKKMTLFVSFTPGGLVIEEGKNCRDWEKNT